MGTLVANKRWYSRKPVSALGKVAAGSLIAIVAVLMGWLVLTEDFGPFALIFVGVFLLFAALIATGWRWAPLLALVPAAFVLLFLGPMLGFLVQRPNTGDFAMTSIVVLLAALAGVAGVAGTIRNYARKTTTAPGWLRYLLYAVAALIAIVLILALLPDAKSGEGVAGATEITVAEFSFPAEGIRVRRARKSSCVLKMKIRPRTALTSMRWAFTRRCRAARRRWSASPPRAGYLFFLLRHSRTRQP